MSIAWENCPEIERFREYLRIPSVHPDIDYEPCVKFLKKQADELTLEFQVYHPAVQTKPVVVLTWVGTSPNLPSIVLNSHMDVVPVFPDKWTHPPFAADMDAEGRIYARGAQDMKCVGMQYLEAIRAFKADGVTFKRTIHVIFVPVFDEKFVSMPDSTSLLQEYFIVRIDEEIGGVLGMRDFVQSSEFKKLNVGFSLDEGIAATDDTFLIYYAERSIWHVHFKISGTAGHGSLLLKNTVGEKLHYLINKLMGFRQQEATRLANNTNLTIGDVTTVNITQVNGGVQSNVIPPLMTICFDIRLAITVDHVDFEKQLRDWCEEAGGGIEIEFEQKQPKVPPTKVDNSNPYWVAFKASLDELGLKTNVRVFPGGTDSRYIRNVGIPAIGFSPMINTPVLLHDHDEFLKAETYLEGIKIYKKIIPKIANV